MARPRKPQSPELTADQMLARIKEIDAWISTSVRFESNIDRLDRLAWHKEERTRQRRERSKLVRRLRKLGIEVKVQDDMEEGEESTD